MKVFFVNHTADNPNWGCRGTTAALRELVREAGGLRSLSISGQCLAPNRGSPGRVRSTVA